MHQSLRMLATKIFCSRLVNRPAKLILQRFPKLRDYVRSKLSNDKTLNIINPRDLTQEERVIYQELKARLGR